MMDKLDEIRARLAAATPGPWESQFLPETGRFAIREKGRIDILGSFRGYSCGEYDAAFIANAPADIAYLLTALDERDQEIALLNATIEVMECCGNCLHEGYCAENDVAKCDELGGYPSAWEIRVKGGGE